LRLRTKHTHRQPFGFFVKLPKERGRCAFWEDQLLRSGTSVAGHVREASRARSDSEFCSKLDGLLQEADEGHLWLELLRDDCGIAGEPLSHPLRESSELMAIFTTMVSNCGKPGINFSITAFQHFSFSALYSNDFRSHSHV